MMSEKKEALYLADHESYLHLKETVTQTGFAYETFDKATGAAQHTGLITYEEMLENPIRNPLACARVMALQEIGLKGEVVSEVALRTLDQIKEARRAYRKEHPEDPHDHSIRFITSDYEELFRIPNGGKVQIDYPDRMLLPVSISMITTPGSAAKHTTSVSSQKFWNAAMAWSVRNRSC